jgi:hypothetical protein
MANVLAGTNAHGAAPLLSSELRRVVTSARRNAALSIALSPACVAELVDFVEHR